jgi:hypothetical protein
MKLLKFIVALSVCVLTGCPLDVIVPPGGNVTSSSTTRDCSSGNTCRFEIDMNFNETFTAVPEPGHEFRWWESGEQLLCGGSTEPVCTISMVPLQGNLDVEKLVASSALGKVQPVFAVVVDFGEDKYFWGLPTTLFRKLPPN